MAPPQLRAIFFGSVLDHVLPFRSPVEMTVLVQRPLISTLQKSRFGLEVRSDIEILQVEGKPPPGADQHALVMLAEGIARAIESRTHVSAILSRPVLVQAERPVETANTIESSVKFTIGKHRADARLL